MSSDSASTYQAERDLIDKFAALSPDDPARASLREALIVLHQPLVRHLAQRYANRGEPLDDLIQAGSIGLIHAVDRFDPERSQTFTAFAMSSILGEIRQHFRLHGWALKVPRRLQDLSRQVNVARQDLEQTLQRAPTITELAHHLDASPEDILDALEAGQSYAVSSLDLPDTDEGTSEQSSEQADEIARVLDRADLAPALADLTDLERKLLSLRFVQDLTQAQIAEKLGIDQSKVSRQIARTLAHLRTQLSDDSA
jgi:RNA polymerase sigma-B factor